MRNGPLSAYEQIDFSFDEAMPNEMRRGVDSLAHAADDPARFAAGARRHGVRAALNT